MNRGSMGMALWALTISCAQAAGPQVKVLNGDAHYPEGPLWSQGRLFYAERDRNTITVWDGTKNTVFATDKDCGPAAIVPRANGFLAACYDKGTLSRITAEGKVLAPYTVDKDGNPFVAPKDLTADGHDGIYFTASGSRGPNIDGKVFFLSSEGVVTEVASSLHGPSGIAVAEDGKLLYVAEMEDNRLLRFDIGANGTLSHRRVFVNLDDMTHHVVHIWPDGIKVSSKGEIYVGQSPRDAKAPLAGKVFVVDTQGKWLRTLSLPSPKPGGITFGADEKVLYVTALDQLDQPPYAGKLYSIDND